jgi:DNA-binding transcriptional LysR family regulator
MEQIEAFIAAARSTNFRMAAEQCALSPAAFSRRIQGLSEFVGHALFKRDSAGMHLTEAGKLYLDELEPSFLELRRAATSSMGLRSTGQSNVKLSLSHSLAVGWLIPRLSAFRAKHPRIDLGLRIKRDASDIRSGEADLAICASGIDLSNLGVQPLLSVTVTPLAHPNIADAFRAGAIRLQNQRLLASAQSPYLWRCWARATGIEDVLVPQATFDVLHGMYEVAAHGAGVVLGASPTVIPHLESGRLVPLGLPTAQLPNFYRLASTPASQRKHAVAVVREWLETEARQTRNPFGTSHPTMKATDIVMPARNRICPSAH